MPEFSPDQLQRHGLQWCVDSTHWHGKVLSGDYCHWCPEWDDLPIDETCGEIVACMCYDEPAFRVAVSKKELELEEYNRLHPISECW